MRLGAYTNFYIKLQMIYGVFVLLQNSGNICNIVTNGNTQKDKRIEVNYHINVMGRLT